VVDTDEVLKNRWWVRLFFTGTILLFGGFVAYIITHPTPPGYVMGSGGKRSATPATHFAPGDTVTIPQGKTVSVGEIRITYRGMDNGHIRLEVVVGSLDPDYAYGLRIAVPEAKAGFRSGERSFRLVSARTSRIRLLLVN
jgi:hypothetical protein